MGISLEIWLTICLGFSGNGAYFVLMTRLVGPQQVMIWLVLWNMFFSIQLGMSSSQLTNSIIFQRGRYTTNQSCSFIRLPYIGRQMPPFSDTPNYQNGEIYIYISLIPIKETVPHIPQS